VPVILNFGSDTGDKACAQRSLWSAAAAAGFPSFAFVKVVKNCILVKALSWWTFSTIS
jgi:hypothetical protein